MKKILAFLILLSSTASAATWSELLTPTNESLAAACSVSYQLQAMPRASAEQTKAFNLANLSAKTGKVLTDMRASGNDPLARMKSLTRPVVIQLPAGGAFNYCTKQATELASQPAVASLPRNVLVYVNGSANNAKTAEGWNAVLSFLDASNSEIVRYQPVSSSKGSLEDWKPNCSGGTCSWYGKNLYLFDVKEVPANTATLRLIFTRGEGIEQRDYKPSDFEQIQLMPTK